MSGRILDVMVDVRRGSPYVRQARGGGAVRRERPAAVRAARLRARLCRAVRAGRRLLQVRQRLQPRRRDRAGLGRSCPWHRLAGEGARSFRRAMPRASGSPTSRNCRPTSPKSMRILLTGTSGQVGGVLAGQARRVRRGRMRRTAPCSISPTSPRSRAKLDVDRAGRHRQSRGLHRGRPRRGRAGAGVPRQRRGAGRDRALGRGAQGAGAAFLDRLRVRRRRRAAVARGRRDRLRFRSTA